MRSCSPSFTPASSTRRLRSAGGRCPGKPGKVGQLLKNEPPSDQTGLGRVLLRQQTQSVLLSDFQKFWCSVDRSLVLYESDRSAEPCLQIDAKDIVCLGVGRPDSASNNNGFIDRSVLSSTPPPAGLRLNTTVLLGPIPTVLLGPSCRFRYTFELYVASEKLFLFGLETADELHSWTKAIGQV